MGVLGPDDLGNAWNARRGEVVRLAADLDALSSAEMCLSSSEAASQKGQSPVVALCSGVGFMRHQTSDASLSACWPAAGSAWVRIPGSGNFIPD